MARRWARARRAPQDSVRAQIFSIYNELVNPTHARIKTVIGVSVGSSLVVYLIVAVLGVLCCGVDSAIPAYRFACVAAHSAR